jgi:hypothetical protein
MMGVNSPDAGQEATTRDSDQKEQEKLEKLNRDDYISEERYKRLTEDLERR